MRIKNNKKINFFLKINKKYKIKKPNIKNN